MAPRVTKSPAAEADLTELWLSKATGTNDAGYATRFLLQLDAYLRQRARFPLAIQPCAAPFEKLRLIAFKRLHIYCRPLPDGIDVVRVLWNSAEPEEHDLSA